MKSGVKAQMRTAFYEIDSSRQALRENAEEERREEISNSIRYSIEAEVVLEHPETGESVTQKIHCSEISVRELKTLLLEYAEKREFHSWELLDNFCPIRLVQHQYHPNGKLEDSVEIANHGDSEERKRDLRDYLERFLIPWRKNPYGVRVSLAEFKRARVDSSKKGDAEFRRILSS